MLIMMAKIHRHKAARKKRQMRAYKCSMGRFFGTSVRNGIPPPIPEPQILCLESLFLLYCMSTSILFDPFGPKYGSGA